MDEKKTGRLQSLKLPRDLSLGIGRSKKQYQPNLNVVRNKDKPKEALKKIDQKRRDRNTHKDKHDKHDSRYVQSTGVFSQGTGEIRRLSSQIEKRVSFRDNSSVSNMVLPTINRNSWNVSKKEEGAVFDDSANCDMDSDDEKMSFAPLTLSLDPVKKIKKEIVAIKKEDDLEPHIPEPFNCDIYNEENPAIALVKLPDSFAGKGLSDDPNVKKLFDYPLSGMLEGQIGKLIIRKSGKLEVQIGRIKYELSPENTYEAKEQLAIINEGEDGKHHLAILGDVSNSFIMFPDYESLLKKK